MPISALIKAGGSLLGGLFGKSSQDKATALQEDALKKGIQWKVADAKKAGIHPLFALGAQTNMPSAIAGNPIGDAIANAGGAIAQGITNKQASNMVAEQHTADLQEKRSRTAANYAQAAMYQSEINRAAQKSNVMKGGPGNAQEIMTYPHGAKLKTGDSSVAEDWEREYGGIVGEGIGFSRYLYDLFDAYSRDFEKWNKKQRNYGPRNHRPSDYYDVSP